MHTSSQNENDPFSSWPRIMFPPARWCSPAPSWGAQDFHTLLNLMSTTSGGQEKQKCVDCFHAQMRAVLGSRNCIVGLLPLLSQTRKLTVLNAKCIYSYMLTKRESSASPFMQCCMLSCTDQNHFEYHCTWKYWM